MRKRERERIRRAEREREREKKGERKEEKEGERSEKKVRVEEAVLEKCGEEKPGGTWWLMAEKEEENEEECMSTKGHASKRINELIISCGGAARCLEGINAKRHVEQWPECR